MILINTFMIFHIWRYQIINVFLKFKFNDNYHKWLSIWIPTSTYFALTMCWLYPFGYSKEIWTNQIVSCIHGEILDQSKGVMHTWWNLDHSNGVTLGSRQVVVHFPSKTKIIVSSRYASLHFLGNTCWGELCLVLAKT